MIFSEPEKNTLLCIILIRVYAVRICKKIKSLSRQTIYAHSVENALKDELFEEVMGLYRLQVKENRINCRKVVDL